MTFSIGKNNLVLGSGTGTVVNISSLCGEDILINGVLPSGCPQQYSLTKSITIEALKDVITFQNMIFNPCDNPSTWTNVNTGAINQTLYNDTFTGYYKCTITQTAISSCNNFECIHVIFDYPLVFSQQTSPDIFPPISFGYKIKPNTAAPTIVIDHLNNPIQSQPIFLLFPGTAVSIPPTVPETMDIEVRLTKLDF